MKNHRIKHLFFFVTTRCNGNCNFCCNWRNIKANDEGERLNLKEIDLISKNLGKLTTVSLSGGEPFLREDLIDICRTFYKNTKFRAISIPTNGLMPKKIAQYVEKIVSYCKKSFVVIELPLDGVYGRYDEIRGSVGAFDRLKETFFELKPIGQCYRNLHIKFNITYSYYNKDSINEILDSAESIFNEKVDFSLGLVHGVPQQNKAGNIDIQSYFDTLATIDNRRNTKNIGNLFLNAMREITNREFKRRLLRNRPSVKCLAIERFIILFYNGEVYPCQPLDNICLGNIRDFSYNLSDVLSRENLGRRMLNMPDRKSCICDWSCGISRSMWSSKTFFIKAFYRLSRDVLRNLK